MNKIIRSICLFALILLFLPALCIPFGNKPVVVYYVISSVFFLALCSFQKKLRKNIKNLMQLSAFKYFLIFIAWCIFSGFINVCLGHYSFGTFLYYIILLLFICYSLSYLFPAVICDYNIFNRRFLIKFFIIMYHIIFMIGLLEFIGKYFNISLLCLPSEVLSSSVFFNENFVEGNRVRSVFSEPGWYGAFVYLNIPLIYTFARTKYKIFKNNILNIGLKNTLIPMLWINIIVTRSAIWLIFNILISIIFLRQYIVNMIKKTYVLISILVLFLILFIIFMLNTSNLESTLGMYYRIVIVCSNVTNPDIILSQIPSLATRILSYAAILKIACSNLLFGIGLGNVQYRIANVLAQKDILTPELIYNLQMSNVAGKMRFCTAIFYQYLAEIGIIGLSLFYYFIYKSYKYLNKIKIFFYGLNKEIIDALLFTHISIACILIYDVPVANYYVFFLLGLSNIYILIGHQYVKLLRRSKK